MKKSNNKAAAEAITVNRRRLLNNDAPFAMKEAYVKLRTSLMFCMTADKARPCKTFAVTSAKPSEGKSLTAANIAISYAMLGKRVLLVDADMRKPTQRRLWKVELSTGLCDYLAKIWQLELAKVTELPLWIVCTGTIPPNPSELLSSDRMKSFVESCADYYDYVIIDTPPINTVADAQIISTFVDGVVLVARSGNTTADELNAATALRDHRTETEAGDGHSRLCRRLGAPRHPAVPPAAGRSGLAVRPRGVCRRSVPLREERAGESVHGPAGTAARSRRPAVPRRRRNGRQRSRAAAGI